MKWDLEKEAQDSVSIPWASAAMLMVELRSSYEVPPEPVMTKKAAAGMFRLTRLVKMAQTPEEAQMMVERAAMTDPNVVAAMDHQQMQAEREALVTHVQALQTENEMAQQQVMMANQAAQQASMQAEQTAQQAEQTAALLHQAQGEREQAMQQAVQARDAAMAKEVDMLQHREQLMQQADQLAMQLKQVAATTPAMQMQQQQAALEQQQMAEQEMAAAEQGAAPAEGGAKRKTQKQVEEAQQAQQEAQVQGQQANQAVAQEQAEQEQAAPMQPPMGAPPMGGPPPQMPPPQMPPPMGAAGGAPGMGPMAQAPAAPAAPTPGAMPKQSSAKVQNIAQLFREKRAASKMSKCSCGAMGKLSALGKCSACGSKHKVAAAAQAILEKRAEKTGILRAIGERAAYATGGAALGGAIGGAKQMAHKHQYGEKAKSTPTDREIDLKGRYMAASMKARRNPTYRNKLHAANIKHKMKLERAGRENPGGQAAQGQRDSRGSCGCGQEGNEVGGSHARSLVGPGVSDREDRRSAVRGARGEDSSGWPRAR
jgi:chemotaxis protein histidine kinase CheA